MHGGYHRPKPNLSEKQIIEWAEAYRARHGRWPTNLSGRIPESPRDTWEDIRNALRRGRRGLRGGSSLSKLLANHQGIPYSTAFQPRPHLKKPQILAWARAYHRRHGVWPGAHHGAISGAEGLTWTAVDLALRHGLRGLSGGSSLANLIGRAPGNSKNIHRPALNYRLILSWAGEHHRRTGKWPNTYSGKLQGHPEENWLAISHALQQGLRGLPGGVTLGMLLQRYRGVPLREARHSKLTIPRILGWIRAHHRRAGKWPKANRTPIPEAPGETWNSVREALWGGHRGLSGGSSLAKLLAEHFGVRNVHGLPRLDKARILQWADEHKKRTGTWPHRYSGRIPNTGGETWASVCEAMYKGGRGWPSGLTLAKLLAQTRGARRAPHLPRLSEDLVLTWAAQYRKRYGEWPYMYSGRVPNAPGETWLRIDVCLRRGNRGLQGGSSLRQLLGERRKPGKFRHR